MLGSRRPAVTLTSRAEAQTANAMAAFDINSPSAALGFGIGELASPVCFRLAFSPVLYEIGYALCFASIGLYVPK